MSLGLDGTHVLVTGGAGFIGMISIFSQFHSLLNHYTTIQESNNCPD